MKSIIIALSILGAFSAQANVEGKISFEENTTVKKVYMNKELSSNLSKNFRGIMGSKLIAKK